MPYPLLKSFMNILCEVWLSPLNNQNLQFTLFQEAGRCSFDMKEQIKVERNMAPTEPNSEEGSLRGLWNGAFKMLPEP